MNYVYILECADGTLYTGWTNDLTARLAAHNSGHGAKYTRGRGPVRLAFSEVFADRGEALSYEAAIKKLTREEKLRLIAGRRTPRAEYLTVLDAHGRPRGAPGAGGPVGGRGKKPPPPPRAFRGAGARLFVSGVTPAPRQSCRCRAGNTCPFSR